MAISLCVAAFAAPVALNAQTGNELIDTRFPELSRYLNISEVLQAAVYDEIVASNNSSDAMIGKALLKEALVELNEAEVSHYHSASDHLAMLGPFRVFESRATPGLQAMIRSEYPAEETDSVLEANGSIPPIAVEVLKRGRDFGNRLIGIYLDDAVYDKHTAVDQALQDYLSDDRLSVAPHPKSSALLSEHPYAYSFRVGFPQLSGLTWASQWLQLATLELAMISRNQDDLEANIENVIALFEEKIAPAHGGLMNLPTDIPTMPVIAPNLYSFHPGAAYVLDNISVLKVVIGDILVNPDVPDRNRAIEEMVAQYTQKDDNLDNETDYLYFVLRGGIYNQGGPARGGMNEQERNRSRAASNIQHISNYPMR
ncbi:MAG: hypothetical protein KDI28_04005 [Pseudomonadales bacterium]|nr:hypothetical protein [Pseudomonadales bacterium]